MNKINKSKTVDNNFKTRISSNDILLGMSKYLKNKINVGDNITLIRMYDEPQMPKNLKGVISHVDDIGQIHVKWENGSTLAINVCLDEYIIN